MGDRLTLDLRCAACDEMNKGVWYAPSSGVEGFKCSFCKEPNVIWPSFEAILVRDMYCEHNSSYGDNCTDCNDACRSNTDN